MSSNRYSGNRLNRMQSDFVDDVDSAPTNVSVPDDNDESMSATSTVPPISSSLFHLVCTDDESRDSGQKIEPKPEKYSGELGTR